MKDDVCELCEARQRIERAVDEQYEEGAPPADRAINICECGGVKHFLVYGVAPATEEEAREFFRALMEAFELSERPPTGPGFFEIYEALEKHEKLATFAAELDVSIRTAEKLVKWATGKTFRKYQAEKASRGKSRMFSRLKFPRRLRRR